MPEPVRYHQRLVGRSAIVTGAGSEGNGVGTGRAIALVLAGEGATVCLVDRDEARAEDTRQRIEDRGGKAFVSVGDITTNQDCRRFVEETVAQTGRLDILVNNVGNSMTVPLDDENEDKWNSVIDVNLKAAMLMMRHSVPAMKATGGGSIVNISSIGGMRAPGGIAYGPSKAGMCALAREVAVLHGRDGIRANTVAPGHIMTPFVEQLISPEMRAMRRNVGPLGLEGDAWDVALATCFLASDEARFITGVLLPVDGGVTEIMPITGHGLIERGRTD